MTERRAAERAAESLPPCADAVDRGALLAQLDPFGDDAAGGGALLPAAPDVSLCFGAQITADHTSLATVAAALDALDGPHTSPSSGGSGGCCAGGTSGSDGDDEGSSSYDDGREDGDKDGAGEAGTRSGVVNKAEEEEGEQERGVLGPHQVRPGYSVVYPDGTTRLSFPRVTVTLHAPLHIVDDYVLAQNEHPAPHGRAPAPASAPADTREGMGSDVGGPLRLGAADAGYTAATPRARNAQCPSCGAALAAPGNVRSLLQPGAAPHLCHYTGLFYCRRCHVRDRAVVPARALHRGDWAAHTVCVAARAALERRLCEPCIPLAALGGSGAGEEKEEQEKEEGGDHQGLPPRVRAFCAGAAALAALARRAPACADCARVLAPLRTTRTRAPQRLVVRAHAPAVPADAAPATVDRSYLLAFAGAVTLLDLYECCCGCGGDSGDGGDGDTDDIVALVETVRRDLATHVALSHPE